MSDLSRKRSRTLSHDHHASFVHNASLDMLNLPNKKSSSSSSSSSTLVTSKKSSQNHTTQQLAFEISNLKTELSTLKSLRSMDQMKAETTEKRLKRYILSLEEDTQSANNLVEEIRVQSEKALEEMITARRNALAETAEWQERYMLLEEERDAEGDGGDELVRKENEHLNQKVQSQEEEIVALRAKLASIAESNYENSASGSPKQQKGTSDNISPVSPAPTAVLSELYRTRNKHDESERLNRQLKQKNSELQTKAEQLAVYKEKAHRAENKVDRLEKELKTIRRERETHRLVEARWTEFRKELLNQNIPSVSMSSSKNDDENTPPEIATVLRHFRFLNGRVEELEADKNSRDVKFGSTQRRMQMSEKKVDELMSELKVLNEEKAKMVDQSRQMEQELKTIQAQEQVWKRHSNSMVSLIDTYEQMEKNVSPKKSQDTLVSGDSSSSNQNNEALQLSLKSANDEINILKNQFMTSKDENTKLQKELEASKEEYERVKKKFEKLREALYQEREKAEQAEKRAFEAESLAGKGSFNLETTRALHLEKNPTSIALKKKYQKEIKELKDQLEEYKSEFDASGKSITKSKAEITKLDAQKLHKRLKESFRAQISRFREGVYLLTGYKIDMVSEFDRTKFKVRSMYAEKESDVLEFIWPELEEGKAPISLDMLNTELGQELSKEPCFKYIERYESLPAFMASVCLSLFERQTMI